MHSFLFSSPITTVIFNSQEYYDKAKLAEGGVGHGFVFFDMAIQHVTRAARVFRQVGKHMLLIGVGGTGKAAASKLAAFIEGCVFVRPYVSRNYNLIEFRDDLKKACVQAGVKFNRTVLFLTDNLVKVREKFYVTILLMVSYCTGWLGNQHVRRKQIENL